MSFAVTHIIYFEDVSEKAPLSGTESHLVDLLKGLAAQKADVELIALVKRHSYRMDTIFTDLDRGGVVVTQVHLGDIFSGWDLFKALFGMCLKRRDRIIHTHLPLASFYGRLAAILARCAGVVETQHNDNPDDAEGGRQLKWQMLDWFTHTTIAISDNVRGFLVNRVGLNPDKIRTIHYGITPPEHLIPREKARNELGIPQDVFCVGFVGKLTRQKNISLLLEAVHNFPNVVLCLIGTGEEENYLKKRVQDMGMTNVIFAGGRDLAADYMTAFNLMVLPSRWEGLGLVLLEAMIRHVPVAGSKNGAIPETLGQGHRGFLFDNAMELRAIIHSMTTNSMYAIEREVTAYQDVLSHYTIRAMVEKTRRVYYEILSNPDIAP